MKSDDIGDRRLVEQNNQMCYEQKEVRNGVVGEGQGLGSSGEGESRVNAVGVDVNSVPGGSIQAQEELQLIPQQLPQGPAVHWEKFLPVRSLKVLLVENDYSTRHVVSALLRNCSYEVTAVSNGFQAWKILEDFSNHIDIILTEVVMPFISGIALLCKIMSHKTFKNIPVVMMSSHDSMGIVFKCLSKGAVDFLVKPIRKNELKNLWQHVWRRSHSSSGSGSESGTQSRKSVKSKKFDESDNNTASSDEQDDRVNGLDIRDGSDNGSGTQSSWTKMEAEVDVPQQVSAWEQLTDAPDSTCAQVIHTKPEAICNELAHAAETKLCQEHDERLELDIRVSGHSELQLEYQHEKSSAQPTTKSQNISPEVDSKPLEEGLTEQTSEILSGKLRAQDHNGSCAIVGSTNPQLESRAFDGPSGLTNISQFKDKAKCDFRELPSVELSLKRLREVEDTGNTEQDGHNVLIQSDLSAFSKYNSNSSANQGLTGNVGSCSPVENGSVAMKTETTQNFPSHSNSTPPNQQSNGSSNVNNMASNKHAILKQEALNEKSESISAFKCLHTSAFQPVHNSRTCPPEQLPPGKTDEVGVGTNHAQLKGSQQQVQVQHHHHYYHHYHHHVHDLNQHKQDQDNDCSLKNMAAAAPQCGSSNAFGGPMKGNTGNCSVNGSASGSNHGSNGQNGGSTALKAEPVNIESENGAAANSEPGGISGRTGRDAGDEDRVAHREAALSKFRQKRKERCFEKRVRYHSRKKLADQRPRVRGQFVRQPVCDANSSKDNQSNELVSDDNSCDSIQ